MFGCRKSIFKSSKIVAIFQFIILEKLKMVDFIFTTVINIAVFKMQAQDSIIFHFLFFGKI